MNTEVVHYAGPPTPAQSQAETASQTLKNPQTPPAAEANDSHELPYTGPGDEIEGECKKYFNVKGEIALEVAIRKQIGDNSKNYLFITHALKLLMNCRGAQMITEQAAASLICRLLDHYPGVFQVWLSHFIDSWGYPYHFRPFIEKDKSFTGSSAAFKALVKEIAEAEALKQPIQPKLVNNNKVTRNMSGTTPKHLIPFLVSMETVRQLKVICNVLSRPSAVHVNKGRADGQLIYSISKITVANNVFSRSGWGVSTWFMDRRGKYWPFEDIKIEADTEGLLGKWEDWMINWDVAGESVGFEDEDSDGGDAAPAVEGEDGEDGRDEETFSLNLCL